MTPVQKEFLKKTFTLKGRIFHPNLVTAVPSKKNDPNSALKFNTMFAFKGEENQAVLAQIAEFLGQAKNMFHPNIPMSFWSNPLKKFDTYVRQDGKPNPDYLKGSYWVNASSGKDFPPQVVGPDRQPILNAAEIYSGRNAVVNIGFYAFSNEKSGLSTNVNAVMLMEGGAKEGGTATVDVNQIFGNFAADMGMANQGSTQANGSQNNASPSNPFGTNTGNNNNGGSFV